MFNEWNKDKELSKPCQAARAYNPGTAEAETGRSPGGSQPGLRTKLCHRERKGRGKKERAQ